MADKPQLGPLSDPTVQRPRPNLSSMETKAGPKPTLSPLNK